MAQKPDRVEYEPFVGWRPTRSTPNPSPVGGSLQLIVAEGETADRCAHRGDRRIDADGTARRPPTRLQPCRSCGARAPRRQRRGLDNGASPLAGGPPQPGIRSTPQRRHRPHGPPTTSSPRRGSRANRLPAPADHRTAGTGGATRGRPFPAEVSAHPAAATDRCRMVESNAPRRMRGRWSRSTSPTTGLARTREAFEQRRVKLTLLPSSCGRSSKARRFADERLVRETGITVHHAVHLGIAVAAGGNLLVPVIRDAVRSITGLALAAVAHHRARTGKIGPDDLAGGIHRQQHRRKRVDPLGTDHRPGRGICDGGGRQARGRAAR